MSGLTPCKCGSGVLVRSVEVIGDLTEFSGLNDCEAATYYGWVLANHGHEVLQMMLDAKSLGFRHAEHPNVDLEGFVTQVSFDTYADECEVCGGYYGELHVARHPDGRWKTRGTDNHLGGWGLIAVGKRADVAAATLAFLEDWGGEHAEARDYLRALEAGD